MYIDPLLVTVDPNFAMSKIQKSTGPPPPISVPCEMRSDARDAIAAVFDAMKSVNDLPYYWHNIIGTNGGSLMHRFGVDALTFASVMFVAGLFKWRKVKNEERHALKADKKEWDTFIAEKKLGNFLQCEVVRVSECYGADGKVLEKSPRMRVTFLKVGDTESDPPRQ